MIWFWILLGIWIEDEKKIDVQYPVLQDIKDDIYECHNINYN